MRNKIIQTIQTCLQEPGPCPWSRDGLTGLTGRLSGPKTHRCSGYRNSGARLSSNRHEALIYALQRMVVTSGLIRLQAVHATKGLGHMGRTIGLPDAPRMTRVTLRPRGSVRSPCTERHGPDGHGRWSGSIRVRFVRAAGPPLL